jgi:rhamnogalacturonyl hydrolase YesR
MKKPTLTCSIGCVILALGLAKTASGELTLRQIELAGRGPVTDVMSRVTACQIKEFGGHAPAHWKAGTFFSGVAAAYQVTGNPDYLRYATEWCESAGWKIPSHPLNADQLCTGQTFLDLYLQLGRTNPVMIADLKIQMEQMFGRETIKRAEIMHARWQGSERPFNGSNIWWWCDALYMAPPVLARMSAATGDPKYRKLLHRLYWESVAFLYNPADHLFLRDEALFQKKTPAGKTAYWGRGNGWVYGGLIRTLDYLPPDDPQREKYIALFRALTQSIVTYQQADGLWRSSLNEPAWYPLSETSASSFFCFGLLAGINRGYLDKTSYLPVALRAWEGLLGCINSDGRLGYAQLVASKPGPVRPSDSVDYAHGGFLLAASELYKMNLTADELRKGPTPAAVSVLAEHAAWPRLADERAWVTDGYLLAGSLDPRAGCAKVTMINLDPVFSDLSWSEQALSSESGSDRSTPPALLKLGDGRVLAVYSKQGGGTSWSWRLATVTKRESAADFVWGEERRFDAGANIAHAGLAQLSAETNRLYAFFIPITDGPTFATSDDGAQAWSKPCMLLRLGNYPYCTKYASNGKDRIDVLFTAAAPNSQTANSVYHLYYTAGNIHRSDGTLIRPLAEIQAGRPLVPEDATLVYTSGNEGRCWVSDLESDRDGSPVIAFISPAGGTAGNGLRYRYACWDATSRQWQERPVACAGAPLSAPESQAASGISLDPNAPNTVYLSTAVEPATGQPGATGRCQLFCGQTQDRGVTWQWKQLTFDAVTDNLLPFVPRQTTLQTCVLWCRASDPSSLSDDTAIVGILKKGSR